MLSIITLMKFAGEAIDENVAAAYRPVALCFDL